MCTTEVVIPGKELYCLKGFYRVLCLFLLVVFRSSCSDQIKLYFVRVTFP